MDSLTQAVLGAAVGEAVLGRKAGNRAILWGTVAGTIPDLDVVIGKVFFDPVYEIYFHRGITHSILFAAIVAPLLGGLVYRLYGRKRGSWLKWSALFFLGLFTHAWLDCHTTWGTQIFWPHEMRVAFKNIFVVDPLYTLPLLITVLVALFLRRGTRLRKSLNIIGLVLSSFYMIITIFHKNIANNAFEQSLREQEVNYSRYDSRPAPLNSVLWSANVETDTSFQIGYYSLLDESRVIRYYEYQKNQELIEPLAERNKKVRMLLNITEGYYIIEQTDTSFIINDLRFGLLRPWMGGETDFVFAYEVVENPETGKIKMYQNRQKLEGAGDYLEEIWKRMVGKTSW